MLIRILTSLYLCFLVPQWAFAQVDTIVLPPNLNDIEWQTPLLGKAYIADTIPFNLSFNKIQKIGFKLFQKDSVFIKDDKCAWLHFKVKNLNLKDTLTFFVTFNRRIHKAYFFSEIGQKIDSIEGGRLIDYHKRSFPDNKACFKLSLPPQYIGSFWLKFNNFSENRSNLYAQLVSKETEEKQRLFDIETRLKEQNIEFFYYILFAFFVILAAHTAYIWLDEGYKWYAIYIGLQLIFYFRGYENYNNQPVIFFSYFSSWHFEIEPTICYLMYISYMVFIQKFLDMKQFYPRLNLRFTYAIKLLLVCFILNLFIQVVWGLSISFPIFVIVRLVFFIFYFVVLFQIAFSTSSALSWFILLGTFCMLLPGLTSNVANAFGGDTSSFGYGFLIIYEFPYVKIPMFSTLTGILLEAIFFIFGLSWKAKRELQELLKLKMVPISQESFEPQYPLSMITDEQVIESVDEKTIENKDKEEDERVKQAFTILDKEFRNTDFTVKKWAQSVYISPSHFAKLITEHTQESPSNHIQRRRLQHAQQLILTTHLSLTQIALECGYADSNYFSRIFKKYSN